jgi:hypothetical protein
MFVVLWVLCKRLRKNVGFGVGLCGIVCGCGFVRNMLVLSRCFVGFCGIWSFGRRLLGNMGVGGVFSYVIGGLGWGVVLGCHFTVSV